MQELFSVLISNYTPVLCVENVVSSKRESKRYKRDGERELSRAVCWFINAAPDKQLSSAPPVVFQ